jgi:hypothetical protein
MTRFLSQQVVKSGGKNITVMTRPTENLNSFAARAPKVVLEARQRLQHAYAKLGYQTDAVRKAAQRYFLTDNLSIPKADMEHIKRVYILTIDGLAGDVTIKAGATVGSGDDDGVTPRSTFDDKAKALDNADSYAWFAYTVGATIN